MRQARAQDCYVFHYTRRELHVNLLVSRGPKQIVSSEGGLSDSRRPSLVTCTPRAVLCRAKDTADEDVPDPHRTEHAPF
jgi:hypothetical protein